MSIATYTGLITSEHADKPNYMAWVAALCQPFVDQQATINGLPEDFDLDNAVGAQLDVDGLWIGISRELQVPLTGVYFSFDTAGVGWDQGTWYRPFDSLSGLTVLADDSYVTLLKSKIGNNRWDGTVPSAYAFLNGVLGKDNAVIQDNQDMTMLFGVIGAVPLTAVQQALLEGGYLNVKPVGVRISNYIAPSVPDAPFFGFDVENSTVSGFDTGGWATLTPGV